MGGGGGDACGGKMGGGGVGVEGGGCLENTNTGLFILPDI